MGGGGGDARWGVGRIIRNNPDSSNAMPDERHTHTHTHTQTHKHTRTHAHTWTMHAGD